jgi:hydrogenase/urease accessory protein HupE
MNPDFHFVLAMEVIVCTASVGIVLRIGECMSPTVVESEVLWSVLEFAMMIALSSKLFMEH